MKYCTKLTNQPTMARTQYEVLELLYSLHPFKLKT